MGQRKKSEALTQKFMLFFPLTTIQSENSNLQNKNWEFLNIPMTEMDNAESGCLVSTESCEDAVHV